MIDERKLLFYLKIELSKNFDVSPGVSSDYTFLCSKYINKKLNGSIWDCTTEG